MVKDLKDAGVPIDGVGIQGHWSVYEPTEEVLHETSETFTDLDLEVQVTELDVSVYEKEHSRRERRADDNDELKQKQVAQYEMIFRTFSDKRTTCQVSPSGTYPTGTAG